MADFIFRHPFFACWHGRPLAAKTLRQVILDAVIHPKLVGQRPHPSQICFGFLGQDGLDAQLIWSQNASGVVQISKHGVHRVPAPDELPLFPVNSINRNHDMNVQPGNSVNEGRVHQHSVGYQNGPAGMILDGIEEAYDPVTKKQRLATDDAEFCEMRQRDNGIGNQAGIQRRKRRANGPMVAFRASLIAGK